MMKTKILALLMSALLGLSTLAGCSQTEESSGDLLAQIQERGEIVIATEGTWAPWTYHDENDELVGYDIEVAKAIAEKLDVTATFVEGEWDGLLSGVESGRYDIMANGVEIDDARREKYDFSVPYAYNRIVIIVRGDNEDIQSFEDLEGKTTANTLQSTYAKMAEQYGATVTAVDDLNQTIQLLLSDRIDATLNSDVTANDYMTAQPDADIKIAAVSEDATQVAIPMRKGEETATLRAAIDEALNELSEEGVLTELSEKYFGIDISQAE